MTVATKARILVTLCSAAWFATSVAQAQDQAARELRPPRTTRPPVFTRRLAGRGTIQYDSLRGRVLLDLLTSYEVRPGTVMYGGYGTLTERLSRGGGETAQYATTGRSVFLKVSYLWRF